MYSHKTNQIPLGISSKHGFGGDVYLRDDVSTGIPLLQQEPRVLVSYVTGVH